MDRLDGQRTTSALSDDLLPGEPSGYNINNIFHGERLTQISSPHAPDTRGGLASEVTNTVSRLAQPCLVEPVSTTGVCMWFADRLTWRRTLPGGRASQKIRRSRGGKGWRKPARKKSYPRFDCAPPLAGQGFGVEVAEVVESIFVPSAICQSRAQCRSSSPKRLP